MPELKVYYDPSVISDDWKIPKEDTPSLLDKQKELWRQMKMPCGKGLSSQEVAKNRDAIANEPPPRQRKPSTQCSTRPNRSHRKKCVECEGAFITQYCNQKYCGAECKRDARNRRKRERHQPKKPEIVQCAAHGCDKFFERNFGKHSYCSDRCRRRSSFRKRFKKQSIKRIAWSETRLGIARCLRDRPEGLIWDELVELLEIPETKTKYLVDGVYKQNHWYRQLSEYLRYQGLIERSEKRSYRDRCPQCGNTHRNISNNRANVLYRCPNNHTYAEYKVDSLYRLTERGYQALQYFEQEQEKNGN